ncbi:MAG TPA: DUF1549 and DUF1553 domain-containing protein [Pirellulales bacterium]|nr:DUF1549 and DUF1553 domain-containing protein [Pirellulales bacterium]
MRTPIDSFILAGLEHENLAPQPPADRATLLRRATIDLTGLPPDPADINAFLADRSPDAWERVIDRLLASPAYGERWAQHWLDLARFAESDGFEFDKVRPDAWRYRDWVIEALNADLPYDEFVQLQIAGDELLPGDRQAAAATGFLLAGPDMPDINSQDERRHNLLNEMTAAVGSVFLGLQIGCAQCHDHKYDPISQFDFYRLRAVFETAEYFQPQPLGRVMHESASPVSTSRLMVRGDFRRPGPKVSPGFPRIANPWNDSVAPPAEEDSSGRRAALARFLTRADHPLATRVIVNRLWQHHFGRGLVTTPSDLGVMGSWPAQPPLLDWLATELPRQGWSLKRMHRLLVTSTVYQQSSRPDFLSVSSRSGTRESSDNKFLFPGERLGEGASAQPGEGPSAQPDPPNNHESPSASLSRRNWTTASAADPDNQHWWRMNRRRLDGETIRDLMLAASDNLSPRRGGPGVMPPLPDEVAATLLKGQWKISLDEEDHRRRSIYLMARRNLRYPLFEAFDRPDALLSCPQRDRSTTAPQALILLNSDFALQQARRLAGYLYARAGNDQDAQITLCYLRVLSRSPTAKELADAREFLTAGAQRLQAENRSPDELALPEPRSADADFCQSAALVQFCLAMFNANEFVYVD